MANRHKANWALAAVTAGYFASYPFSGTFAGGLISSACGAAMVGGLADWFAVTALFRKPLGFSYRTALIPRNREKIFRIMADMVEKELLTTANIKETLKRYSLAELLLHYLQDQGGKQEVKSILAAAGTQFIQSVDADDLGRTLELLLHKEGAGIKLSPLLAAGIEWSLHWGYGDKLITFILDEAIRLANNEQTPRLLGDLVVEAQATYERGMARRKIFNKLVEQIMHITPLRFGIIIQRRLVELLEKLKDPEHPLRRKLQIWLLSLVESLKTDEQLQVKVEMWKKQQLAAHWKLRDQCVALINQFYHTDADAPIESRLERLINKRIDQWVEELDKNDQMQQQVDVQIKQQITMWLDNRNNQLGSLVMERLQQFTNDELVTFVEARAGDDLQMIRINGSVVGGLLGILIYVATYWLW